MASLSDSCPKQKLSNLMNTSLIHVTLIRKFFSDFISLISKTTFPTVASNTMQGPAPWALLDLVLSKGDIAHWSRYTGHCPVPWACHACLCLRAFVLAGWLCLEFTVDPSSPPGPCLRIILSASLTSIFKHYKLPPSFLHFSSLSCFVLSIALIPWRIITLISYFVYRLG